MQVTTQTVVTVVVFVLLLAMVPAAIKWLQARSAAGLATSRSGTRLVSAVAVGPHQRVVTVEVGPSDARTWLVLGVTPQSISCLHQIAAQSERAENPLVSATRS